MKFRIGFLGAWALFVIAVGALALAVAAEAENVRDARRMARLETIDRMIEDRLAGPYEDLRAQAGERAGRVSQLRSRIAKTEVKLDDSEDTDQTIIVSTAENRVVVRRGGNIVFRAICSTGKGTTLVENGRTMVFETPTGRFKVRSKEENPVWVPPDWHYVEEARKKGGTVVRLRPGEAVDAATGAPVSVDGAGGSAGGVWTLLQGKARPKGKVLTIENGSVVEVRPDGSRRELPEGELIRAGKTVVIPPVTAPQRHFGKVLGRYRLNLGGGYALHGTQAVDQLGRPASHGCVRLADKDLETLYGMTKVGDQVIIY